MEKEKSIFRFKQFGVSHSQSSMKVGTDAVLLGAWANVSDQFNILEIGTGCGIISLMIAQRNKHATIDAIDIDLKSIAEATINFDKSPWADRLLAHHCPLQEFNSIKKYDHIVSNPPYFAAGTKSPLLQRYNARHTNALTFEELVACSKKLLSQTGKISLVLPAEASSTLHEIMEKHQLNLHKRLNFRAKEKGKTERILLTFGLLDEPFEEESMYHYNDDATWSDEYKELTKDFYLKL